MTYTGPELEFFLFKKDGEFPTQPVPHDQAFARRQPSVASLSPAAEG